jgi:hypothetical protein
MSSFGATVHKIATDSKLSRRLVIEYSSIASQPQGNRGAVREGSDWQLSYGLQGNSNHLRSY